jgi:hypothetical protein
MKLEIEKFQSGVPRFIFVELADLHGCTSVFYSYSKCYNLCTVLVSRACGVCRVWWMLFVITAPYGCHSYRVNGRKRMPPCPMRLLKSLNCAYIC